MQPPPKTRPLGPPAPTSDNEGYVAREGRGRHGGGLIGTRWLGVAERSRVAQTELWRGGFPDPSCSGVSIRGAVAGSVVEEVIVGDFEDVVFL